MLRVKIVSGQSSETIFRYKLWEIKKKLRR
jgi:hypothetical protein